MSTQESSNLNSNIDININMLLPKVHTVLRILIFMTSVYIQKVVHRSIYSICFMPASGITILNIK